MSQPLPLFILRDKMNRIGKEYNDFCMLVGEPIIGKNTWVGYFTLLDGSGGLIIGQNCDIASGVHIYTHSTTNRVLQNIPRTNRDMIQKEVTTIGNNVFIGANTTILMGCMVGDFSVIGANSVLLERTVVGKREMWAGNPAKRIK